MEMDAIEPVLRYMFNFTNIDDYLLPLDDAWAILGHCKEDEFEKAEHIVRLRFPTWNGRLMAIPRDTYDSHMLKKNVKTFTSTATGKTYEIKDCLDCDSKQVVYLITCQFCRAQYVGSTRNKCRYRTSNNKSDIRNDKRDSAGYVSHFQTEPLHNIIPGWPQAPDQWDPTFPDPELNWEDTEALMGIAQLHWNLVWQVGATGGQNLLRFLSDLHVDLNARNFRDCTVVHYAADVEQNAEMLAFIIENPEELGSDKSRKIKS